MPKSLSAHFTLDELTASQAATRKGIDNTPTPDVLRNLQSLAAVLEKIRTLLGGVSIIVSSGYRSPAVNKAVGGAKNSAHMSGLAADFTAPKFGTVLQTARMIAASEINYNQPIYEYGAWVHISLAAPGAVPRRENLSIFKGTPYLKGLVSRPA